MTNTSKLQYISVGGTEVLVNKIKENISAISSEATTARAAEKANADAIAVLNGDSNTEGSIKKAIKDLINAAPEELDTLGEIAEQLNNNENATAAINNVITKHVADAEKQRAELAKLIQANTESIKNNQTAIDTNKLTKITWADLKAKRDAGELIPGVQYRITDYNCTTTQTDTQSAGHQFDIIVTADSNNKLNEVARAIRHEGDENLPDATSTTTDSVTIKTAYFANSKLEAWKIWYCLDNDTSRFAWADATNGKGVIYRMIDEWNNDCPYDFKNIQFKRYKITAAKSSDLVGTYLGVEDNPNTGISIDSNDNIWCYTFTAQVAVKTGNNFVIPDNAPYIDGSLESPYRHMSDKSSSTYHDNKIGSYLIIYDKDDRVPTLCGKYYLPDNVFIGYFESTTNAAAKDFCYAYCSYNITLDNNCYSNSFGNDCYSNSFGNNCSGNSFGNEYYYNSFGNSCSGNSFGDGCSDNSFGNGCCSNSFGNGCFYNSFGDVYYSNSFENSCSGNSFGNKCRSNSFGNNCSDNSFGNECYSNSFGNSCSGNSFGNDGYSNSFGDGCSDNSFGNNYSHNSFGNGCFYNSFGNEYYYNSFGNICSDNSFGDGCSHNSFGDGCSDNSFGNNCSHNSFGNECYSNSFGNNCSDNKLNDYYQCNKFENGVKYVQFSGDGISGAYVQNYHIKQGMVFTSSTKHTITAKTGLTYELSVAKQSDGTVVEYCEADYTSGIVEYTAADVEALFA